MKRGKNLVIATSDLSFRFFSHSRSLAFICGSILNLSRRRTSQTETPDAKVSSGMPITYPLERVVSAIGQWFDAADVLRPGAGGDQLIHVGEPERAVDEKLGVGGVRGAEKLRQAGGLEAGVGVGGDLVDQLGGAADDDQAAGLALAAAPITNESAAVAGLSLAVRIAF